MKDTINYPKSGASIIYYSHEEAAKAEKLKEMKYLFEKLKETEGKTDNDQLLDNYIQQVSDQQNQIGELQKTIMELREQTKQHRKELIKKDLHRILNAEVDDIDDGTVDDIVDYILERENK